MALPLESQRSFRLYVTHVDGDGHFLKICGQLDQPSSLMIESLFETARDHLENGIGSVSPETIQEGIICAAKYKDGAYYRAKIISTTNLSTGLVGVQFIDYGNKDIISLKSLRFLDNYDPMFLQLRGLATEYYLARIMHQSGRWDEPLLLNLQSLLCYAEYPITVEGQTLTLPLISIQFKGTDFSSHLLSNRLGVAVSVAKQEVLMLQHSGSDSLQPSNWQQNFMVESPIYTEHVPFLINQNFPSNPASAMRVQHNASLPFNGSMVPAPSAISQRLAAHKVSRGPVKLRAPIRQPQVAVDSPPIVAAATTPTAPVTSKKSTTYKSRLLECNSQHKVFVSYAEEGPELFAVQLGTDAQKLQDMMDDINRRPHSSLTEPPMIGTVCLGRMPGDRIICRAIVMNLWGSQCKLFFVDFGDTEMVSYYDIFDIPEDFVKPNVFATRFCLSGVKKLDKSPYLNEAFKQLVAGKVMTLRVVAPEGPPLIQYGELYLDNKNVLDLLLANMKDKLQFKWLDMLQLGSQYSVLVSYVDSCLKFYVQLSDQIDDLNAVMDAIKAHCESTSSPGELPVGAACCARFADDGNWYRACVRSTKDNKVVVAYVDYGNEQEVAVSDLRTITPDLIKLPAQAMKCALKGFENKPVETKTSNQLEMLALEKTLTAKIVGVLSSDTMLVTLIDDTVFPPLDVARKMNQLSQPRSNTETKPTTPVSMTAPETFSSPEGGSDDGRRKFSREKSFKDERRRDQPEDLGQRAGSFRNRENREPFDRAGPGRHSDKFAGRPDNRHGDRRGAGGGKPWEPSAASPPAAADEWEEGPAPSRPGLRDNRRKPKPEQHEKTGPKPGWKHKDPGGVGKRLKQAAEAASADAQKPKGSIQDRLKRDNKYNKQDEWEEKKPEERFSGAREPRGERFERREPRGERREHWADKKESWGDKKESRESWGDKREPRNGRGERGRGNPTPRDRADRSFGSDRSGGSGRAPHKPRGPFTHAQYKELADPVPLDTPFAEPAVEPGAQHEVAVTWIVSPHSFYSQILAQQPAFLEMMHGIPEMYKGVRPYSGAVGVGASVLARYPADGVLYRATVVAVQPLSKLVVQYVDFGNKQLVDAKDIWQLERRLTELPRMAVHCRLLGVAPEGGEWRADPAVDRCFDAPRYRCVFADAAEGQQRVSLWSDGASVADRLVAEGLAVAAPCDPPPAVALKDEPIDLAMIVGQQMPCRVTHVESFDKLYVQLDLDKAALVERAVDDLDAAKLTPLAAEEAAAGAHCTVRHEGRVFRAVLGAAAAARWPAVLPDYGRTVTAALDDLMILPAELSVYYYQSLECRLHKYTAESKRLVSEEELRARLLGNKFIVYVDGVEGTSLLATLYDLATGRKLALFEPDEGAFGEVAPLCPRTVFGANFGAASVQHLQAPGELHLQRAADGPRAQALLDDLFAFYEEGSPEPLTEFAADTLCAAKSADENWYRAVIVSAADDAATVQYPDYGNSETVPKAQLRRLDPRFHEPCALALAAGLGLEPLGEGALARLAEWTADREVQATLAPGADGWVASLHLDGADLALRLVSEGLAAPRAPAPAAPPGCTPVYVSHIDTPGHFWLQPADAVARIDEVQAELQAGAAAYPELAAREVGALCAAQYSADELWYRARVLDLDADITTVRFVDYGNTDVLDNRPGLLRELPEALRRVEPLAQRASVNAVPTGTGQWSERAADSFAELVGDTAAPVDALVVLRDETTYVDLFVAGADLTDRLVAQGHAARAERPACGALPACFASHVNSPAEFWIQLESAAPELQAMEAAMVDAERFPALPAREEGALCAAKYPEDEAWYRAQVVADGSGGTEVLFTDYGNASIAAELRSLPAELAAKPALSRKCALQKPRHVKAWSRRSEARFADLAAEGATVFKVQFIASGDVSIVELFLDGRSVTEELLALCEVRPAPGPGRLCYVDVAGEFYVHMDARAADLDRVTELLGDAESFEPEAEPAVGALCAAFWDEDGQWYRARVLERGDTGCRVQFVDYGNAARCERLRRLPATAAAPAPLAARCRLAALDAAADLVAEKLEQYMADDATFHIEFIDSSSEPALVKLLLDGEDISPTFTASRPSETEIVATVQDTEEGLKETKPITTDTDSVKTLNKELDSSSEVDFTASSPSETEIVATVQDTEEGLKETKPITTDTDSVKTLNKELDSSSEVDFTASRPSETEIVVTVQDTEEGLKETKPITTDTDSVKALNKELDSSSEVDFNASRPSETEIVATVQDTEEGLKETNPITTDTDSVKALNKELYSSSEVDSNEQVTESSAPVSESEHIKTPHASIPTDSKEVETADSCNEKTIDGEPESSVTMLEEEDEFEDANEINSPKLDESLESTHTVIENKSFEANLDDILDDTDVKADQFQSPERDTSSETLENSDDTIKTPERDDSKDSINTDTGYTSSGDATLSKDNSPLRESNDVTEQSNPALSTITENKLESHNKKIEELTNMEPDLSKEGKTEVDPALTKSC